MSLPENSNIAFLLKIISLFIILALGFLQPKNIISEDENNLSDIRSINMTSTVIAKKTLFE